MLSCDLLGDELCDCRRSIAGCTEKRLEVRCSDIVGDLLKLSGVELELGGGVHRLIIASVTTDDLRLTGVYIAVDGDRALFACRDIERG